MKWYTVFFNNANAKNFKERVFFKQICASDIEDLTKKVKAHLTEGVTVREAFCHWGYNVEITA